MVFDKITINFCDGINVFIGENATGKSLLLKVLYSVCRSNRTDTDFGQEIVHTMLSNDFRIARFVNRRKGNHNTEIKVYTSSGNDISEVQLGNTLDKKTKKNAVAVTGKEKWEKTYKDNSSIFISAKEILSHSYKLTAATNVDKVCFDDMYIDIINSAKIDIVMGKSPGSRAAMLKRIEEMTNSGVVYGVSKDEFYLKEEIQNRSLVLSQKVSKKWDFSAYV